MRFLPGAPPPRPADERVPALAALATAIDLYRDMEMIFWLPQAEAALAQVVKEDEGHA